MQAHIIATGEDSGVFVFYGEQDSFSVPAALELYRFVKTIPLERLADPSSPVGGAIPHVLERLLLDHDSVLLIDHDHVPGEETISKVLTSLGSRGEVIVSANDHGGRMGRLKPSLADRSFPLLAYTRGGYVERIRPVLDCRRGLWRPGEEDRSRRPRSLVSPTAPILRRGALGLPSTSPNGKNPSPLVMAQFEGTHREQMITGRPHATRIGIGLEIMEGDTLISFRAYKLAPLLRSLEQQDRTAYQIIVYVCVASRSISRAQLLRDIESTVLPERVAIKVGSVPIAAERSDLVFEAAAWKDSCEHFVFFGTPVAIPTFSWLDRLVRFPVLHQTPRLFLVTAIDKGEDLWMLRELAGSIHSLVADRPVESPPLLIIIGGANLKKTEVAMIKLWESVEYHDEEELFFGFKVGQDGLAIDGEDRELKRLMLLDIFIRLYGSAVWIDKSLFFTGTLLNQVSPLQQLGADLMVKGQIRVGSPKDLVVEGYDGDTFARLFKDFRRCVITLDCRRQLAEHRLINPTNSLAGYQLQSLLPRPVDPAQRGQMYCHLSLRPEVMYAPQLFSTGRESISQWAFPTKDIRLWKEGVGKRLRVALLVPSKSAPGEAPGQVHLLQTFFKSMLTSVTADEWERFQYVVYVGYDEDDPVLDRAREDFVKAMADIRGETRGEDVMFKFRRLPTAKCVTLLWNVLFLDAIADGNDYFYQINDDVSLLDSGWTSKFVDRLRENRDFGVVGPNDQLWDCRLLTQSFVSRRHWEIFGWYFPTIIKDWYSDNWISEVYGPSHTHCIRDAGIKNGAASTRYNVCNKPKWREALEESRSTIEKWRRSQIEI